MLVALCEGGGCVCGGCGLGSSWPAGNDSRVTAFTRWAPEPEPLLEAEVQAIALPQLLNTGPASRRREHVLAPWVAFASPDNTPVGGAWVLGSRELNSKHVVALQSRWHARLLVFRRPGVLVRDARLLRPLRSSHCHHQPRMPPRQDVVHHRSPDGVDMTAPLVLARTAWSMLGQRAAAASIASLLQPCCDSLLCCVVP
jgi:hypothetical protein